MTLLHFHLCTVICLQSVLFPNKEKEDCNQILNFEEVTTNQATFLHLFLPVEILLAAILSLLISIWKVATPEFIVNFLYYFQIENMKDVIEECLRSEKSMNCIVSSVLKGEP